MMKTILCHCVCMWQVLAKPFTYISSYISVDRHNIIIIIITLNPSSSIVIEIQTLLSDQSVSPAEILNSSIMCNTMVNSIKSVLDQPRQQRGTIHRYKLFSL